MGPFDRFNDRAKRVLALAQDEAIRLNHNYIGPEHLILGLVREGEGVAARALDSLGLKLSDLRTRIEFLVGRGDASTSPSLITLHPRSKKIIELAIDEARKLGHSHVGTEHLLLGVVREGDSMASRALEALGVSLERVRQQVIATLGQQHVPPAAEPVTPRQYGRAEPSADRVLAFALDLAKTLGHEHLGTEHVLLALISVDSPASRVLASLGVTYDAALASVTTLVPRRDATPSEIEFAPRVNALIGYARGYADGSGGAYSASTLLLALVADPEGVGMQVLGMLGVSAEKVRHLLGRATGSTSSAPTSASTAGARVRRGPFDWFTDRTKRVLALSQQEAIRLGHNYIGTEHLLLGLMCEGSSVAAMALNAAGLDVDKARHEVERVVGRGTTAVTPTEITLSPRTKKVLELANDEAQRLGATETAPAHLLLGMLREGEGIACGILEGADVSLQSLRADVLRRLADPGANPSA